jgi:hypothetical protein
MPENICESLQRLVTVSQRADALGEQLRSLEHTVRDDVEALEIRLRIAEGKIIALETQLASQRESMREMVRDTMRVELAEQRARAAEEQLRRARPALEEG